MNILYCFNLRVNRKLIPIRKSLICGRKGVNIKLRAKASLWNVCLGSIYEHYEILKSYGFINPFWAKWEGPNGYYQGLISKRDWWSNDKWVKL